MTKGNPGEAVFGEDTNFRTKFKKALKYAGLPNVRVHDLRHTYASHLVMNGTPIYSVAQLLGHSTIEMSSRYSHLDMSHLHQAVSKLAFGDGTRTEAGSSEQVKPPEVDSVQSTETFCTRPDKCGGVPTSSLSPTHG